MAVGVIINVGLRISSEVNFFTSIEDSVKVEFKDWLGIVVNWVNVVWLDDINDNWFWIVESRCLVKVSIIVVVLLDSLSSGQERGSEEGFHQ